MPARIADTPADRHLQFRFAINMGEVVSDGDLIYGDGVAIASRMEALAEPGGINISRAVRDQVRDRLPIMFEDMGRSEEHTSELQSHLNLVCRLLLEKKKKKQNNNRPVC